MAECIPFKMPGSDVTGQASATIVGCRFVSISGNMQADGSITVAHTAAGLRALGVSKYDAATGEKVGVYCGKNYVLPVTAGANIAAGAAVEVGTNGQAITLASGVAVGVAETAATSGQPARVRLI
jgi:hypothetical protein